MIPFFSIIIPTYNSDTTLYKCLESIISQSFTDFEILIIDGVSKDNTIEITKGFNDERIKILSEPDNGIYDAMNKGIKLAKGDWLYFLGSDDELFNCRVLSDIKSSINLTNSKIIYGNVRIIGDAGWANDKDIYDGIFTLKKILEKNICHQAIFYNKVVFSKLGNYNVNYKICADYDFNLKCWAHFHFHYENLIVSFFNGGNFSASLIDNNFSQDAWDNIVNYFKWKLLKSEFSAYKHKINSTNKSLLIKTIIKLRLVICYFKNYFL